jgi:hypothetical protein
MANSQEGDIWVTRQVHQNIVAVASLKDHAGIILVHGAEPAKDTLDKAIKENIPLMVSEQSGFEVVGQIYTLIKGGGEQRGYRPLRTMGIRVFFLIFFQDTNHAQGVSL